jgi:hypothetical protein
VRRPQPPYPPSVLAAALVALTVALPQHGMVVPSKSFGGLRLGASRARVERAWGTRHGTCAGCLEPTLYFTYERFEPQGAGVSFRNRAAVSFFTLWSPSGWHTNRGLAIGDADTRITELYGALPRAECGTYSALVLRRRGTDTQFYVRQQRVWGFGLSRAGVPPCH